MMNHPLGLLLGGLGGLARLACVLLLLAVAACSDSGGDTSAVGGGDAGDTDDTTATSGDDTPAPALIGSACASDSDCVSGLCLKSEFGPPWCSRLCDDPQVVCEPGDDIGLGEALCISYSELPNVNTDPFLGDHETFCTVLCADVDDCQAINPTWEVCDTPKYLGDPLYPGLGLGQKICMAPSYQGKDPVDPQLCDWEKTVDPLFGSEANLCRNYCDYLLLCKEVEDQTFEEACCEWGCFNQMVLEGEINDPWFDEVKCFWDTHNAYPEVGVANACSEPPKECLGGDPPIDPTPPAAAN